MTKPKKGRTADKLIDSVLTDLKEEAQKANSETPEDSNLFLDALRESRSEVDGSDLADSPPAGESEAPEGLVVKKEATIVQKNEDPQGMIDLNAKKVIELPEPPESSLPSSVPVREDSATLQLEEDSITGKSDSTASVAMSNTNLTDRTQPMGQFRPSSVGNVKPAFGYGKPVGRDLAANSGASDAQMVQAENLRLAQTRILELENEAEKLRQENELLTAAGTIAKTRLDELTEKIHLVERSKIDAIEHASLEMKILKESLLERDRETAKAKRKVEELETRLNSDLKKIRVRERELENRLELSRLEKTALVRSKDENILDLKRKMDLITSELENYKQRTSELQEKIDNQHDQIGRTVRALRLALTNLESSDTSSDAVLPLKKAE